VGVRLVVLAVAAQSGQVAIVRSFRSTRILPALLLAPPFLFESVPLVFINPDCRLIFFVCALG
jgi:hypothetical protein